MELRPYNESDYELTRALETNPAVMRHLGGPLPIDQIRLIHEKRLAGIAKGDWFFAIVPDDSPAPVGIIGVWQTEWDGALIHELGLMMKPESQRLHLGWEATAAVVERARTQRAFPDLHAFIDVNNVASNEGVRQFGFRLLGECDSDYEGRPLRSNHWVISFDQ